MMRNATRVLLWASVLAGVSCGSPPPVAAPPPAAPSAKPPEEQPKTPRQELLAKLGGLRSPDVLEVLPADLRGALADRVAQLSAEERRALASPEWAQRRPVLHLVVGGKDPDALYNIVTGGAAAELIETRAAGGDTQLRGLAQPITDMTLAAAERWLFEARLDIATPSGATPALCEKISEVASVLGRLDLQLLARRTAVASEPTPARRAEVARVLALQLESDAAQGLLDELRREGAGEGAETVRLQRQLDEVQALIDRSRIASAPDKGATVAASVEQARALLDVGRPGEARALLEPHQAQAGEHLALATTLTMAELDGTTCPGLPPSNPHIMGCSVAWREEARVQRALPVLDRAWQSRRGRDDEAVEAYLGLGHVMPWLYSTMGRLDADPAQVMKESQARVARLHAAVKEAAAERQRFVGLVLFVDLLAAGLEAADSRGEGERVRLGDARRNALVSQAEALAARYPNEPHAQAAVLGAGALLAQDRDSADLLAKLPRRVASRHRHARWSLDVWQAVAHDRKEVAERARQDLMELLKEEEPSLKRSKLVLTMAEADAALGGTPQDYANLMQVADGLAQHPLPPELAARVALDRAGVLERQGKRAEAIQVLMSVANSERRPATTAEADLTVLARAFLVYLRGLASEGAERAEYAEKLRAFTGQVGGQVSVSVVVAHGLWLRELDYLAALDKCKTVRCNLPYLESQRVTASNEVAKIIGTESARFVERGVIPLGAVTASFTFSPGEGLQPSVALEPILPACPLPKTK